MAIYRISTDAATQEIEAPNADAAAHLFAENVDSAASLAAWLEDVGGYGSMTCVDTGEIIFRVED